MIFVGILGALILLIAWMFEAEESVRRHKSLVDLRFAVLYLVANVLLTIYSFQIDNIVFLLLQIGLLCIVLFEIFYTISIKKIRKK